MLLDGFWVVKLTHRVLLANKGNGFVVICSGDSLADTSVYSGHFLTMLKAVVTAQHHWQIAARH